MMMKKEKLGTISGIELLKKRSGKLNRNDGIVKSGTGYHKDCKTYNRKGKKNQQLKNKLKNYGTQLLFIRCQKVYVFPIH